MFLSTPVFIPSEAPPIIKKVLSFPCSGHKILALTGSGIVYADNTIPAHGNSILGMTIGASNIGELTSIQTGGEIVEPSWSLIVGAPVYLNVNGSFTQVAPSTPGTILLQIGFATSLNSIELKFNSPILIS